ncbi:uncharacterized protein [Panulirus ornatus]|uniref:uncharacterized protein isoform X1 n=1 Tax=Panulirus ornatus TaxID=150431 RepID=UPI003A87CF18
MMYGNLATSPLCLWAPLLAALLLGATVASADDQVVHPWTITSGCPIPSLPGDHPVSRYRLHWLNLKDMVKLSPVFWLMFYGKMHNMETCGLRQGILYRLQRHNASSFSYEEKEVDRRGGGDDHAPPARVCKDDKVLVLGEGSYGFISCAESRQKATLEAGLWWDALPTFYITIVLICVGVVMGVVVVVGVVVCVRRRRRTRRNFGLT